MKTRILKRLLIVIMSFSLSAKAFASGAAGGAQSQLLTGMIGMGQTGQFTAGMASSCGPKNIPACIMAILGALQMGAQGLNMLQTAGVRDSFSDPGFNWGEPGTGSGFCLDSKSCTPDALDLQLKAFDTAIRTGKTSDLQNALSKVSDKNKKLIGNLAKTAGVKVDLEKGTITKKDGTVIQASGQSLPISAALRRAAELKNAKVQNAYASKIEGADGKSQKRGLASTGGPSGLGLNAKAYQIEEGGSKKGFAFGSMSNDKKKKDKESFLASLSKTATGGVGVAGDDLFGMLQRRYKTKNKNQEFINISNQKK